MSPYLELAAELEQELEEARDTIERLIEEKRGITKQRDTLSKQFAMAMDENLSLREDVITLRNAICKACEKFEAVQWGYDGDCGSGQIIEELEDTIAENK